MTPHDPDEIRFDISCPYDIHPVWTPVRIEELGLVLDGIFARMRALGILGNADAATPRSESFGDWLKRSAALLEECAERRDAEGRENRQRENRRSGGGKQSTGAEGRARGGLPGCRHVANFLAVFTAGSRGRASAMPNNTQRWRWYNASVPMDTPTNTISTPKTAIVKGDAPA